jgi:mannose-6-phosphate isomerase-like protein (cupin superfamily)
MLEESRRKAAPTLNCHSERAKLPSEATGLRIHWDAVELRAGVAVDFSLRSERQIGKIKAADGLDARSAHLISPPISPMKTNALIALFALAFISRVAAADAPPPPPPSLTEVSLFAHAQVDDAFAKSLPLLVNSSYKIQAGRRVVAGSVEIHDHDTDILFFTEGSATIVTGGVAVDPKTTAAGEIRADKMTGGTTHHVTKGDVIVIPAGVTHWFTEVSNPCLYFVVKVTK